MTNNFEFWRLVPLLLSAPAQTAFALIYSLRIFGAGEWWKDFVGRALFFKSMILAVLLDLIALVITRNIFIGTYKHLSWHIGYNAIDRAIVVGYIFICIAIYYQLYALLKSRYLKDNTSRDGVSNT